MLPVLPCSGYSGLSVSWFLNLTASCRSLTVSCRIWLPGSTTHNSRTMTDIGTIRARCIEEVLTALPSCLCFVWLSTGHLLCSFSDRDSADRLPVVHTVREWLDSDRGTSESEGVTNSMSMSCLRIVHCHLLTFNSRTYCLHPYPPYLCSKVPATKPPAARLSGRIAS